MPKDSSMRSPSSLFIAAALLILAVAFAYALRFRFPLSASFLEKTELRTLDARFLIRGPLPISKLEEAAEQVAIVAMDDAATGKFSRVLPRETHAQLVAQLRKAGARAIIFDVI